MARRLLLLVLVGLVPAGVALGAKPASWAAAEIRLLGQDPTTFRADDTVTRGELAELLAQLSPAAPAKPEVPLTMQDLDARLVAVGGQRHLLRHGLGDRLIRRASCGVLVVR